MAQMKRRASSEKNSTDGASKVKKAKRGLETQGNRIRTKPIRTASHHSALKEIDSFEGLDSDGEADGVVTLGKDHSSTFDEAPVNGDAGRKPGKGSSAAHANATSSREAHAKQKALIQERKAAKPNADLILQSKKLWERLRRKSHVPLAERKGLVAELFDIVTGRVKDFVLKHDAVRVVQTAIKYANPSQRKMIAHELKGEFRQLAESRYAKFLIGKLLVHGDEEVRDLIIPEFYGSVRRTIKHPEASWILDDIYRGIATPPQKAALLREWYGAEFALFKNTASSETTSRLAEILVQSPEKRTPIMHALHDLINHLVQKKMTGFTMLHDAMLEYFQNTKPGGDEANEFMELLKGDEEGDLLKNLAFTKSGSRVVCLALAYGSAKDRKHILRSYKNTISLLAYDLHGHRVILAALDLIDDTVLTYKAIFPELLGKDEATQQETILQAAVHLNARIPFLYLLAGPAKWLLSADDVAILQEIEHIRSSTSKKDPVTRRQELLRALSPNLLHAVETHATPLCQSSFGCQFVMEVLLGCEGEKSKALAQVADLAKGDPGDDEHMVKRAAAGRMLKTLVLGGRFNPKISSIEAVEPALAFHNLLYPRIKPYLAAWATGAGSFVTLAMLETPSFGQREELLRELQKHREVIAKVAMEETEEQKLRRTTSEVEGKKGSHKRRDEVKGNQGARLILALLESRP
ncbi:MAG: pumilio domain member 6 [Thelocarpon superellum]|nr:MAG: pumilio domain member 6 [Thelocarpon superellum]